MRIGAFILAATFTALASAGHAGSIRGGRCLDGLIPVLIAGHFSGSVDCRRDRLSIRPVGHIDAEGHTFAVYDYRYSLFKICPDCAVHGGQRIIILRDGRYLGQYKPEPVRVAVRGKGLVLSPAVDNDTPYRAPVSVPLTNGGPPATLWIGGEALEFFQ